MKIQLQTLDDGKGLLIPKNFLEECHFAESVNCRVENGRIIIEKFQSKKDRPEKFVNYVMEFCKAENKAALAALKGADSSHHKKQEKSFHYLAPFYIDTNNESEWKPYATIASAIAKSNAEKNGATGIGRTIARCYGVSHSGDKKESKEIDAQAVNKLSRLLACDSTSEVCRVLRPLFSLIDSKGLAKNINYISLLRDLEYFNIDSNRERTKEYWTRDFYRRLNDAEQINES